MIWVSRDQLTLRGAEKEGNSLDPNSSEIVKEKGRCGRNCCQVEAIGEPRKEQEERKLGHDTGALPDIGGGGRNLLYYSRHVSLPFIQFGSYQLNCSNANNLELLMNRNHDSNDIFLLCVVNYSNNAPNVHKNTKSIGIRLVTDGFRHAHCLSFVSKYMLDRVKRESLCVYEIIHIYKIQYIYHNISIRSQLCFNCSVIFNYRLCRFWDTMISKSVHHDIWLLYMYEYIPT